MSEIRTCEQYVVAELIETKNKVENLEIDLDVANAQCNLVKEELDTIKDFLIRRCTFRKADDGTFYISISSVWDKYDEVDYALLTSILGMPVEGGDF